jgi:hypothetical protein
MRMRTEGTRQSHLPHDHSEVVLRREVFPWWHCTPGNGKALDTELESNGFQPLPYLDTG